MNLKTRLSARYLSYFIAFASLSTSLFVSPVEAQTWELKFILARENLCAFNGQTADRSLSVEPGDDIIIEVKNNTSAKHFFNWQGAMHYSGLGSTIGTQAVFRRFYSLQKLVEAGETLSYYWKMGGQGILIHDCHLL